MIDKIVTAYRKVEMGIISGLAGTTAVVIDEAGFYDVGYMQTQINRIKKELQRVTSELETLIEIKEDSDYGRGKKSELMEQRERLLCRMVFLASNSFANLDFCVKMAEGHDFPFTRCIDALAAYNRGDRKASFDMLEAYFKEHKSVDGHFLVNKVFGLLLADRGQYKKAIPFLTYALQFIPDDKECLECLMECYGREQETKRRHVVSEILSVLR